jgi:hypothetical protein
MDVSGHIDTKDPYETNTEVRKIYESLFGSRLFDKVECALSDIVRLFDGVYPGYQQCDTPYHDLEHTLQAYLATARMFDGLLQEDPALIPHDFVILGLISALFHDTGLIKETGDIEGTGAKYIQIHVERGRKLAGNYLSKLRFKPLEINFVKNNISCTDLWPVLSRIPFNLEVERTVRDIVATADYLGQMSDPGYLQKLPMLYEELREGGVSGYTSARDLIEKTPAFFQNFVMKRLNEDFNSVYRLAAVHFKGKNLYIQGMIKNITKLKANISDLQLPVEAGTTTQGLSIDRLTV